MPKLDKVNIHTSSGAVCRRESKSTLFEIKPIVHEPRFLRPLSRINPRAGDLKQTVLTVFDAHDAFPILTLRLLRAGGATNHEGTPPSSSPPTPAPVGLEASVPGEVCATAWRNGQFSGGFSCGGDATEDWTIVSGGGDGAVAHWSVVGLATAREVAEGVEEAGVELRKTGDYEVRVVACTGLACCLLRNI